MGSDEAGAVRAMGVTGRPAVLGHRGNTLEALGEVRGRGSDGVEFDVRRSADGALVLHHDAVVADLGPISKLVSRQLPAWIPSLDSALDVCRGLVVNIEIKNLPGDPDHDPSQRAATEVAATIQGRSLHSQVIVSSFSIATIDAVRGADPEIPTALLTLPAWDQFTALTNARSRGHWALHPHHSAVTPLLVEAARANDMWVIPWAVDTEDDIRRTVAHGVDAFITDRPDLAVAALARRADEAGTILRRAGLAYPDDTSAALAADPRGKEGRSR